MEESANPNQTSFDDSLPEPYGDDHESMLFDDEPEGELVPELLEPLPLGAAAVIPNESEFDDDFQEHVFRGGGSRKPVNDPSKSPFNRICQLEITRASGGRPLIGTGWVIANRMVITAGHCVWRHADRQWVRSIKVSFGKNGGDAIESMTVRRSGNSNPFDTPKAFIRSNPELTSSSKHDYGAILLPRKVSAGVKRMGVSSEYSDRRLMKSQFNIFGYPTDLGGTVMYGMGTRLKGVSDRLLKYQIDTHAGQSGAPVFHFYRDSQGKAKYIVVGIHNGGEEGVANYAARIEEKVGSTLDRWRRIGER